MRKKQRSGSLKRAGGRAARRGVRAPRAAERKEVERALRESVERFRLIAEASYDAITAIDSEGRFTFISPSIERIIGYRPEELLGVQFRSFVLESEMPRVVRAFNHMMKGENVEGLQLEVKRKDGSLVHIEVDGSPILKDGQVLGMQGTLRDITERRCAEVALNQSEAKHRTLVEQSLQGILIAQSPPPHLVFANPAMAKMLGYTPDELTSLSPKETEGLVHPEDRAMFFGRFSDRLQGRPAPSRYEIRAIRKDGEVRWLDFSSNRIEYQGRPAVQATFVDITERKRVEDALRQQYSTLEGIINSSDAPIFSVDRRYRYTSFNRAHASVMKAIYGKDIEIGKSLLDYMTVTEDRGKAKRNLDRALAGEQFVEESYSGEEARSRLYFEVSHNPVVAKDGAVIGVAVYARDLTERREMEQELRSNEARFRALIEKSRDMIFLLNPDGMMRYVSPSVRHIMGYNPEHLVGRNIFELIDPNDSNRVVEGWRRYLQTHEVPSPSDTLVIRVRHADGSWHIHEGTGTNLLSDPAVAAYVINSRDITERKRAEETLKMSEEKYRSLFEKVPHAIYQSSPEAKLLTANPALITLLGYDSEKELLEVDLERDVYVNPEERKRGRRELEAQGEIRDAELVLKRKNGGRIIVLDSAHAVRDEQGTLLYYEGALTDITERKRAEEALRRSEAKIRGVLDALPDLVFHVGSDGVFLDYHAVRPEDLALPPEAFLGKSMRDVFPQIAEDALAAMAAAKRTGGVQTIEYQLPTMGGKVGEYEARFAPTDMGDFLVVVRDITERKRATAALQESEEKLKQSEDRFRGIAERSFDAILTADLEGRITYASPAVERITGYGQNEVVGASFQRFLPESEISRGIRILTQAIEGEVAENVEANILKKDGSIACLEFHASPILKDGRLAGFQGIARDITERKLAEEALQRSEEKYRGLVENINEVVLSVDITGLLTYVSPAIERATGYKANELIGQPISSFIHPDDLASLMSRFPRALAGGLEPIECRVLDKDGGIRFVRVTGRPQMEAGKLVGLTGVIFDITERRNMQAELEKYAKHLEELVEERTRRLREGEERTRAILNSTTAILVVIDRLGTIVDANRTFCEALRVGSESVVGRNVFELLAEPSVLAGRRDSIDKVFLSGKPARLEDRRHERWFDTIIYPIRGADGSVVAVAVSASDITERKQMEEELRAARERLEYVISSNPAVVFTGKPRADLSDYEATYMSQRVAELTGFEPDDFINHPETWERHVNPDDYRRYLAAVPDLWKSGHLAIEYRFLHKDGSYRWIRGEAKVVRDADGKPIEVNGYWIDITERKQMEKRLAESERLAAIGEAAAMIGHDLRNPLQTVTGTLYLARRMVASEKDENRKEAVGLLAELNAEIQYMDKIVSDLQDYARPAEVDRVETSLPDLVRATVSSVKIPTNVEVTVNVGGDLSNVRVDPALFRRVLTNLILNAVQAMPEGGKLTIVGSRGDESFTVAVQDTGVGITPENLGRVFTPFFTTKARGQGLGLPVCKRLVEAQGGTIAVTSQVGEGSTFTLSMPTNRGSAAT